MIQNRHYSLVPHDDRWATAYSEKKALLETILGPTIKCIEHVGSTSIPGIQAKPQIDIVVMVENLPEIAQYYDAMVEHGFIARGDYTGMGEEYFTQDRSDGSRIASVHIVPVGHKEGVEMILLRDYLRENSQARDRYQSAKLAASSAHPNDYQSYVNAKKITINALRSEARAWKESKR